jgi:LPXTG-site transpeptidase (sortase) family protein
LYLLFIGCISILYATNALPEALIPATSSAREGYASVVQVGSIEQQGMISAEATSTQKSIAYQSQNSAPVASVKNVQIQEVATKPAITTPAKSAAPKPAVVKPATAKPTTPSFVPSTLGQDPLRVIIDRVGLNTRVVNPASTNIAALDAELKLGAARYPGSPGLGAGNTFIMAHSTSFKVVNNQAYKAFNGLKFTEVGDIVRVQSIDREYRYRVTNRRMAPNSEIFVPFTVGKGTITLVTCNVLGAKEDRYIVDAELIEVVPLSLN